MSFSRSHSVPAGLGAERSPTQEENQGSTFPALPQDPAADYPVPSWIHELANARAGRQSRASSIVSTRTRFSTTTFDDTRSVDIQAGGQTFRISRLGDRVTETTAPPPYSGPNDVDDDEFIVHPSEGLHLDQDVEDLYHLPRDRHHLSHHAAGPRAKRRRRVRIAMPDHEGTNTQHEDDEPSPADTPSRELTDVEMRQIILDLPARLKSVLGITLDGSELDGNVSSDANTPSRSDLPVQKNAGASSLTLSPSIRPLQEDGHTGSSQVRGILRNVPDRMPHHSDAMLNVSGARDLSPSLSTEAEERNHSRDSQIPPIAADFRSTRSRNEGDVGPTLGDLNELSQVYNKVIRDLDREHRKQLHERSKELDQIRILLHEKDIVYRQQLKGKDFIIEDLKHRLDRFEEMMEIRIEKERNAVEDVWEERWREHQKQLMEKCGLIKPALSTHSTRGTQTEESHS